MSDYKIWIARDEGLYDSEDEGTKLVGKLHMFYDSPELLFNPSTWRKYWGNARVICELPSYMYPKVEECKCIVYDEYKFIN